MTTLKQQLIDILPTKIQPPDPLFTLYTWIENNGLVEKSDNGFLYGRISCDWDFSPDITFTASSQASLKYWFNIPELTDEIASRLIIFAESGMDGSMLGLWLDDNNEIKFVHLGSGSGSMLCCVIADDIIDFLTLLSIGYNEIGFVYDFSLPPEEMDDDVKINTTFVDWLQRTFGIVRPPNGANIVKELAEMWDKDARDPFCLWCMKQFPAE